MSQVKVLDPLVAQQVAAGEVVDRPASVVKELRENALDAAATRIEVEVADGGRERLLVRDDGSGMSEEDARMSVLRHATSKIRAASDIESVRNFNCALPSRSLGTATAHFSSATPRSTAPAVTTLPRQPSTDAEQETASVAQPPYVLQGDFEAADQRLLRQPRDVWREHDVV